MSDDSEDDEFEEENRLKIRRELLGERKIVRRKVIDILVEVIFFLSILYSVRNKLC